MPKVQIRPRPNQPDKHNASGLRSLSGKPYLDQPEPEPTWQKRWLEYLCELDPIVYYRILGLLAIFCFFAVFVRVVTVSLDAGSARIEKAERSTTQRPAVPVAKPNPASR